MHAQWRHSLVSVPGYHPSLAVRTASDEKLDESLGMRLVIYSLAGSLAGQTIFVLTRLARETISRARRFLYLRERSERNYLNVLVDLIRSVQIEMKVLPP